MNIARDACRIRTASSPHVKLMSSLAFNPRFFSPCGSPSSKLGIIMLDWSEH